MTGFWPGALATGSFYSACGPTIHDIRRGKNDSDEIEVRCSLCRAVILVAGNQRLQR